MAGKIKKGRARIRICRDDSKLVDRFHHSYIINQSSGCWEWMKKPNGGYGRICIDGVKTMLAHRYSWIINYGDIPEGMCVLHKCDNRICVNPSHLFLGNNTDNNADRDVKGRTSRISRNAGEINGNAKLTDDEVEHIRISDSSPKIIAKMLNISVSLVSMVRNNKRRAVVKCQKHIV